jgi:hypothetical protein
MNAYCVKKVFHVIANKLLLTGSIGFVGNRLENILLKVQRSLKGMNETFF